MEVQTMFKKILCLAMVAVMMLCVMPITASAAEEGTVVYENDFPMPQLSPILSSFVQNGRSMTESSI